MADWLKCFLDEIQLVNDMEQVSIKLTVALLAVLIQESSESDHGTFGSSLLDWSVKDAILGVVIVA